MHKNRAREIRMLSICLSAIEENLLLKKYFKCYKIYYNFYEFIKSMLEYENKNKQNISNEEALEYDQFKYIMREIGAGDLVDNVEEIAKEGNVLLQ